MKDEAILLYDKVIKVTVFFFFISPNSLAKSVLSKKNKLVTLFLVTPLRRYAVTGFINNLKRATKNVQLFGSMAAKRVE